MPYEPHKNGRPRRENAQTTTIAFRITHEELASLRKSAELAHETLAHTIRETLAKGGLFRFAPAGTAQQG